MGWSGLNQIIHAADGGASSLCGGRVAGCCRRRHSVYEGSVCTGRLGETQVVLKQSNSVKNQQGRRGRTG